MDEKKRSCNCCQHQQICLLHRALINFIDQYVFYLEREDLSQEFFCLLAKKCQYFVPEKGT